MVSASFDTGDYQGSLVADNYYRVKTSLEWEVEETAGMKRTKRYQSLPSL